MSRRAALAASTDMPPVQGTVDVAVPVAVLWEAFTHANWWPWWNTCFFWAYNRNLVVGKALIWCFQPIAWWYLYKMPAIARIVEVEPEHRVTWEVTALPGFYARHTYQMEDLGNGRTRFGSWEQAMGWSFRLTRRFWIAHFTFVKDRSLEGARRLEAVYSRAGKLTPDVLEPRRSWRFWGGIVAVLALLAAGVIGAWLYVSYLRLTEVQLAPGVYAVLGSGNSLVVEDGSDRLLVDTKFPPASTWLRKRIARHSRAPVTMIVNTHYHYDHTQGNTEYPGARIFAHKAVPGLMKARDGRWWAEHPSGIPTDLVDDAATLQVGGQSVALMHLGAAHTHGDLLVHLRRDNAEIVATGDIVLQGYYPFLDLDEGGVDVPGMIRIIRLLATKYPNATFLPGHGPVATAADLIRYADYLQFLSEAVDRASKAGASEAQAVAGIDLSIWKLVALPSYHNGRLCWATAKNNVRWLYQLVTQTVPPDHCTF
jgi:glyoxylase-like metal-dependent hydrolase (beta-lactamase superfamily II)